MELSGSLQALVAFPIGRNHEPQNPLNIGLYGPQSRYRRIVEKKSLLYRLGFEPRQESPLPNYYTYYYKLTSALLKCRIYKIFNLLKIYRFRFQ